MKTLKLFCLVLILALSTLPALASGQPLRKDDGKNEKIAFVQKSLPVLGIKTDRTDGLMSKKTSKAIKKFQKNFKQFKLKPTGLLDDATYRAIEDALNSRRGARPIAPPPAGKGAGVIQTAALYKGVPYRFGGVDAKGFDCSGYTAFVFQKHNIALPRTADVQYKVGSAVARNALAVGDLVFFETYAKGASHVGIYAGGGKFWHASSSRGVMLSGLDEQYWRSRYLGARRVL
ncbi:MAG: C40 family peptidase [Acidaminococcales bacterium]|nr:C40 family peptidase [Acidaminococcales bacterium]